MKENQAILEIIKNENLEAVKRIGKLFMTLAKMGFALLKKVPWKKMSYLVVLIFSFAVIIIAHFIKFFAENIAESDFDSSGSSGEEDNHWNFQGDSGIWMNQHGQFTAYNNGDPSNIWVPDNN